MYNFEGFGMRLQALRKQHNMTQEELASRLGVTGQAVSKWEKEQNYPDITLIPTLATVFDTDIDYLFGRQAPPPPMGSEPLFPPTYEELPLVHHTGLVGCYSDKAVDSVQGTHVKFTDGSTAELSNRRVTNKGQGSIRFLSEDNADDAGWNIGKSLGNMFSNIFGRGEGHGGGSATEASFSFGATQSIDIAVLSNICEVVHSQDQGTHVTAVGTPRFISLLNVTENNGVLVIDFAQNNVNIGSWKNNKVTVAVPYHEGEKARVTINGSGSLTSHIARYQAGNLTVNGSGDVNMHAFGECAMKINGSGDITVKDIAADAKADINGSGDITFTGAQNVSATVNGSGDIGLSHARSLKTRINGSGDITVGKLIGGGDFSAGIAGSGDIEIGSGTCEMFHVDIVGSGEVTARDLTARNANITLHDSGEVTLGRVLESSTEQIKRRGTITILQRG